MGSRIGGLADVAGAEIFRNRSILKTVSAHPMRDQV
jgi:hypothetical protein